MQHCLKTLSAGLVAVCAVLSASAVETQPIEGGTLSAVVADAVPSGSEVVFAGGVLAVGTGVSIPSILTVDGLAYQVESGRTGKWTLMTVADGAAAVPHVNGLPKGYTTSFGGGALTLHNFRAMIIVVR